MAPQIWFITGASSGMGRAVTEYVLSQGGIAIATLRKPEVLADLSTKYGKDKLLLLKLDVTHPQEILDAFAKAKEVFGRIDVVYNNAGSGMMGEVEGTPIDQARALFDLNFWGAANVAREAVRFFREENQPSGGFLINVSSIASLSIVGGIGFYGATKFALNGLTEALAQELNPAWNIKVSILELGEFQTNMTGTKGSIIHTPIHPAYDDPSLASYAVRKYIESDPVVSGNAKKGAVKIYELAGLENPPLHFPLGKDALAAAASKSKIYAEASEKYKSWSDDVGNN